MTAENTCSIRLVDIVHDSHAGVLVGPDLEEKLAETIFKRMAADSALCVEGIPAMHGRIAPGEQGYDAVSERLWPNIKHLTADRPLYGADCRPRLDYGLHFKVGAELDALLDFLDRSVRLTELPATADEAIEWVRRDKRAFSFAERPSARVRECADRVFRREKAWIKSYGELALRCSRTHSEVYVIAGLTHAIGLHLKHGWPLMRLTGDDPRFTPDFIYRAGMNLASFADEARRS